MKACVASVRVQSKSVRFVFVEVEIFVTFCFSTNASIARRQGVREDEETRCRGSLDVDEEEERESKRILVEIFERVFIVVLTRTRT